jgi:hypothetical protein
MLNMVKIQQRIAPRPYMKNKRVYNYERRNVSIIKEFHSVSDPFLKQELLEKVIVQNGSLVIVLTPKTVAKPGANTKAP